MLRELVFYRYNNSKTDIFEQGSIPNSVEKLEICYEMVQNRFELIPMSVKDLTIKAWRYSPKSTDIIPSSVTKLSVYSIFHGIGFASTDPKENTIEKEWIPQSVTDLTLICPEITYLPGSIPDSVKKLHFNPRYLVEQVIPQSVVDLKYIHKSGEQFPSGLIPNGVKSVHLVANSIEKGSIPESVTKFTAVLQNPILNHNGYLPSGLTTLCVVEQLTQNTQFPLTSMLTHLDCVFETLQIKFGFEEVITIPAKARSGFGLGLNGSIPAVLNQGQSVS
eukprot:gene8463-10394_t